MKVSRYLIPQWNSASWPDLGIRLEKPDLFLPWGTPREEVRNIIGRKGLLRDTSVLNDDTRFRVEFLDCQITLSLSFRTEYDSGKEEVWGKTLKRLPGADSYAESRRIWSIIEAEHLEGRGVQKTLSGCFFEDLPRNLPKDFETLDQKLISEFGEPQIKANPQVDFWGPSMWKFEYSEVCHAMRSDRSDYPEQYMYVRRKYRPDLEAHFQERVRTREAFFWQW